MIYVLGIFLLASVVYNFFSTKLIAEQSIKLDRLNFELFSMKMKSDLERARDSEDVSKPTTTERIIQ